MIKYICDRCDNQQAEDNEADRGMMPMEFPQRVLHLCKKCLHDLTGLGYTWEQSRKHMYENCIMNKQKPTKTYFTKEEQK